MQIAYYAAKISYFFIRGSPFKFLILFVPTSIPRCLHMICMYMNCRADECTYHSNNGDRPLVSIGGNRLMYIGRSHVYAFLKTFLGVRTFTLFNKNNDALIIRRSHFFTLLTVPPPPPIHRVLNGEVMT